MESNIRHSALVRAPATVAGEELPDETELALVKQVLAQARQNVKAIVNQELESEVIGAETLNLRLKRHR